MMHTRSVFFRCPIRCEMVPHQLPVRPEPDDEFRFETVRCRLCNRIHFVNLATGKEISETE